MKQKTPKAKCLDPAWKYTPAIATNLKVRFDKERKRLRDLQTQTPKVTQLRKLNK